MNLIKLQSTLLLIILCTFSYSQTQYIGLQEESNVLIAKEELAESGEYWPRSQLIGDTLYVCTSTGIYCKNISTSLNDTIWSLYAFPNVPIRNFVKNDNLVFAIAAKKTDSLALFSNDNGASYANRTSSFFFNYEYENTIFDVDINPNNPNVLVVLHHAYGVARSLDFGITWEEMNTTAGGFQERFITYHDLDSSSIYYGGETMSYSSYIFASFDNGENWTLTGNYHNHATHCLYFDNTDENIIISGNEGIIRKSYDKGLTWDIKAITPIYIYSIRNDPDNPGTLYATGDTHGYNSTINIYRSEDNGENWTLSYQETIPDVNGAVDMHVKDGKIFLYTKARGILVLDTDLLNINNDLEVQDKFLLYPNPINDFLTLEVKDFELSGLIFQLYDMGGKLLQNEKITGNQTSIVTDKLIPATYFVKIIKENKEIRTLKIIKH